jgi:hypothetical protein
VRDKIWIELTRCTPKKWPKTKTSTVLRGLVGFLCGLVYLGAWLVAIICGLGVIFNIVAMELNLADTDLESEEPYMIGQWGPWCSTGFVLLAALIGKYHEPVTDGILRGFKWVWGSMLGHCRLQSGIYHHEKVQDSEEDHILAPETSNKKMTSALSNSWKFLEYSIANFGKEWENFYDWCYHPDEISVDTPRHPSREDLSKPLLHTIS